MERLAVRSRWRSTLLGQLKVTPQYQADLNLRPIRYGGGCKGGKCTCPVSQISEREEIPSRRIAKLWKVEHCFEMIPRVITAPKRPPYVIGIPSAANGNTISALACCE